MATIGTYNEEGECADLYIPRKCNATNSLITSYDHAAIQINICDIDADGKMIQGSKGTTFCIAGYLRAQGESDHAINHLAIEHGVIRIKSGKKPKASKAPQQKSRNAAKPAPKGQQQKGKNAGKNAAKPAPKGQQQKGNAPVGAKPVAKGQRKTKA